MLIAQTATRSDRISKKVPAQEQRAEWLPAYESYAGITRDQFNEAGLGSLSLTQATLLMFSIHEIKDKASEDAIKQHTTYTCGPIPSGKYDKVRVYVEVSDSAPTEVASGLRQRLRSISDVEIVYTPIEADLGISILAYEDSLQTGRRIGYTASYVTYDPCKGSFGDRDWDLKLMDNHFLITGPDMTALVESVASDVDTKDLEGVRKLHDAIRKSLPSR